MGDMRMPIPPNSLPMGGAPGPFGYIDTGGSAEKRDSGFIMYTPCMTASAASTSDAVQEERAVALLADAHAVTAARVGV